MIMELLFWKGKSKKKLELLVTLWPSFPHYLRFSEDKRIAGIRLNSAMISNPELEKELEMLKTMEEKVPLYFDIKGRQLRITQVRLNPDYLDISINHPIQVDTPTVVLFKAGADDAILDHVEDGNRLIFQGGPGMMVDAGESLHIRDESLMTWGPQFTPEEIGKIEQVRKFGFKKYFLSYVQSQRDVDEFRELVGRDAEVWLKIEDKKGLNYVATEFRKDPNLILVAAQGDMYVEIERPHEILNALKLIIQKDPEACVGSRILLSVIHDSVPSCADFEQLGFLYEIGYRRMMLCDELCLKESLLSTAINAFCAFRNSINF
jgi:hypothetical protein